MYQYFKKSYIGAIVEIDSKNFIFNLLKIIHLVLIENWNTDINTTFVELKNLTDIKIFKINWSFDLIKKWLGSENSAQISKLQREYIIELIRLIEEWLKEENK